MDAASEIVRLVGNENVRHSPPRPARHPLRRINESQTLSTTSGKAERVNNSHVCLLGSRSISEPTLRTDGTTGIIAAHLTDQRHWPNCCRIPGKCKMHTTPFHACRQRQLVHAMTYRTITCRQIRDLGQHRSHLRPAPWNLCRPWLSAARLPSTR